MSARWLFALVAALIAAASAAPVSAQVSASPYTSATRYDAAGRATGTISADPDGSGPLPFLATRTTYDAGGRATKIEQGTLGVWQSDEVAPSAWSGFTVSQTIETSYDVLDRKTAVWSYGATGGVKALTQYSYDAAGRLECTAVRMNPAVYATLSVGACTLGTRGTGAGDYGDDRITKLSYDAAGQLLKTTVAYGTADQADQETNSYTPNGKLATVTDGEGNRTTFEYDGHDRLAKTRYPVPAQGALASSTTDYELLTYDANGNVLTRRKRDGSVLTYSYDALNRMTVKIVPERTGLDAIHTRDVYYGYDLRGLQLYARFASATGKGMTQSYDGFGRLIESTENWISTVRTLAYQYDADGNRTRLTYPDSGNYVTYAYDGLNRSTAVLRNGSATVAAYAYAATGERTGLTGGVTTAYGYDPVGRLESLSHSLPASAANTSWSFAYTPSSQIAGLTRSNDDYAWTGAANVDRTYATNGLNQYTTAGPASFCYDANGNLTADGSSVYLYDVENRLVEKRAQSNTDCAALSYAGALQAGLRYDVLGRLYATLGPSLVETRLFYDGDALIGEYTDTGTLLRRYVHGADQKADDPLAWYEGAGFTGAEERRLRTDWQGSIVLVTDSTGSTILATDRYDEYGIPQASNAGRFGYTGQTWLPELGMWYYKARIYSPTLGRFMQTDPIGYKDGINWYAYVGNDPVDRVDPSGEEGSALNAFMEGAYEARTGDVSRHPANESLGNTLARYLGYGLIYAQNERSMRIPNVASARRSAPVARPPVGRPGTRGYPDHRADVRGSGRAQAEAYARPGERVVTEGPVVGYPGVRRTADNQIVGTDGRTRLVVESERRPNGSYHTKRVKELEACGIECQTRVVPRRP